MTVPFVSRISVAKGVTDSASAGLNRTSASIVANTRPTACSRSFATTSTSVYPCVIAHANPMSAARNVFPDFFGFPHTRSR